jgi:tetratricopeptide (TPR) repeat protein
MSLITDLLSKVKQREPKRDVPPILKDTVVQSTAERRTRKRLMVALALVFAVVAAGFGAIYLIDFLKEPSLVTRAPVVATTTIQPAPQVVTPQPSQQSEVRTPATADEDPKAIETAVTPARGKDSLTHPSEKKLTRKKYAKGIKPEARDRLKEIRQEKASGVEPMGSEKETKRFSKEDRDAALYVARTYEIQKKYRQALSRYMEVLEMEPTNYAVMNNVSSMLIYLGSYEEAIRYAQKALNVRKDYVPPLINMGIGYGQLGKYFESENSFLKALEIEQANQYALLNIGLLYEKQGAFDKANKYFVKLSETGDAQGYLGLARLAEKQQRVADAIRFYKMALSMENIDPQISNTVNERLMQLTK